MSKRLKLIGILSLVLLCFIMASCSDESKEMPDEYDGTLSDQDSLNHQHSWTTWTITQVATCESTGYQSRTCTVCGEIEGESIDALGHTFGEWETTEEILCTFGGEKKRICSVCDTEEIEIIEVGEHSFGEWETISESTCTSYGERKRICSLCNAEETEHLESLAHSFGEWKTVVKGTCTTSEERERTCSLCKTTETQKVAISGHSMGEFVQVKAPTCTDDGQNKRSCANCNHEETETVPAKGHTFVNYICTVCKAVAPEKAPQIVKIANPSLLLPLNTPVKLDVQVYPADALYSTITYTIDERFNSCGATITEDGILSCTKLGSVRIRATADNVSSAYVTFNVPTEIRTAEDFNAIRNNLKGYYILCNDIDLSAYPTWTPIGYATKSTDGSLSYSGTGFQGEFNGNGYTISGVNIDLDKTNLTTVGLFGFVDTSAVVSNVKIEADINGDASTSEYIGTLAGVNYGVVNNCEVKSTIDINGALYLGGIVGQNNGNLNNSTANVSINASNNNYDGYYIGGVAGQFVIGNMDNNSATANITISSCKFCYVGGITGNAYGSFSGISSNSTINVYANSSSNSYIGGVIGKVEDSDSEITFDLKNTAITGSITVNKASTLYVGGVAGYGDVFNNCISDVDINIKNSGTTYVGGVVGGATKLSNGENNGTISVTSNSTACVGGLAGVSTDISNGKNNSNISVKSDSSAYVGGLGAVSTKISNAINKGTISVDSSSSAYVGGVAGTTETISDATNYVDISVDASKASFGGVAGEAKTAKNVYNYGYDLSLNASSSALFGGIVGKCDDKVEDSYNTANMKVTRCDSSLYLGGIVGSSETTSNTIKNATNSGKITVDTSNLSTVYIGGISGRSATVSNCENTATSILVKSKNYSGSYEQSNVGGLCGSSTATIENSYSYASVEMNNSGTYSSSSYKVLIGGLAGNAKNVYGSYATGDVTVSIYNGYVNAGGLVGNLTGSASNCYARGSVTSVTTNEVKIGGLVAYAQSGSNIKNCYAAYNYLTTNITSNGSTAYVGGLVADNDGSVTDSYAMNYINTIGSGSGDTIYAGGVIGYNNGTVSRSYSASATDHVLNPDISVDIDCSSNLSANVYVGGFVGYNYGTINNSYSRAAVIGRSCYTGGFVGYQESGGRINNSIAYAPVNSGISGQTHTGGFSGSDAGYYSNCIFSTTGTQISADNGAGGTTVSGIVGKGEIDLLSSSTLSGFDSSVWTIANGSLPTLTLNGNWKVYNDGYDNFNILKNVVNPERQYVNVANSMVEIKFESNWDLPSPEPIVLEKGSKVSVPINIPVEGFGFFGWYWDKDLTKPFTFQDSYTITDNITLYGYFRKITNIPSSKTYTYTGTEITLNTVNLTSEFYTVSGTYVATNAGKHTVKLTLNKNYCWSDGTADVKEIVWEIQPKTVTIPTGGNYTLSNNEITLKNIDTSGLIYTINGTYKASVIGDYKCTLSLVNKNNYKWSDNTTEDKTIEWSTVNGTCGSNVTWQLYSDGALVLKGTGDIQNYSNAPWYDQRGNITSITISDGITYIGKNAFKGCSGVTNIVVPDSVTSIGISAFEGCSSLASITIPFVGTAKEGTNNTHLGYIFGASSYSYNDDYIPTSLKAVVITGGTSIGKYAFYNCSNLTSITIPDSVTSIAANAFYNCGGLTSIVVEEGNTKYHSNGNCLIVTDDKVLILGSNNSVIPTDGSVTTIGEHAFYNCSGLTSITIPNNVTSIGSYAFSGCGGLTNITIPNSVTKLDNYMFSGCSSLASISIPNSVTSIDTSAFYGCSGLKSITVESGNTKYHSAGNCLIETESKKLVLGCSNSVIPTDGSVTIIGSYAFRKCIDLKSITIPNSVTNIESGAFHECSGLANITISDGVTSIEKGAFYSCSSLESITLPFVGASKDGTSNTHFGYIFGASSYSYNDDYVPTSLKTVVITGGTNIADNAFRNCNNLTSITIPNGVTSIGSSAFYNCSGLTNIIIPDSVTGIGSSAFYSCSSLESITLPFVGASKDGTSNTHFGYIFGASSYSYNDNYVPTSLKTVVITGGTSIGDYAFCGCSKLTSITIPKDVTKIGVYAFSECTNLESASFNTLSGWWYSSSSTATSGTEILSSDLESTSTAATYLKTTYSNRYWNRS